MLRFAVRSPFLGRYGVFVETAHDGEEAMTMIRQSHYDAVLTDIRLPDMTGAECYSRIRIFTSTCRSSS
ncbi:MAG: response regulator [Planctomycetaceae bacterium]